MGLKCLQSINGKLVTVWLLGIGINNQRERASEVVEYHHLVNQHQQNVGRIDLSGFIGLVELGFYIANRVITEVTHPTTVEYWQILNRRTGLRFTARFNGRQRVITVPRLGQFAVPEKTDLFPGDL